MESIRDITNKSQLKTLLDQIVKQFNNTGTVTLTPSSTTTIITNGKINTQSVILLMPKTSSAAVSNSSLWIVPSTGQATLNHTNTSTVDRTFNYAIIGI